MAPAPAESYTWPAQAFRMRPTHGRRWPDVPRIQPPPPPLSCVSSEGASIPLTGHGSPFMEDERESLGAGDQLRKGGRYRRCAKVGGNKRRVRLPLLRSGACSTPIYESLGPWPSSMPYGAIWPREAPARQEAF